MDRVSLRDPRLCGVGPRLGPSVAPSVLLGSWVTGSRTRAVCLAPSLAPSIAHSLVCMSHWIQNPLRVSGPCLAPSLPPSVLDHVVLDPEPVAFVSCPSGTQLSPQPGVNDGSLDPEPVV